MPFNEWLRSLKLVCSLGAFWIGIVLGARRGDRYERGH